MHQSGAFHPILYNTAVAKVCVIIISSHGNRFWDVRYESDKEEPNFN